MPDYWQFPTVSMGLGIPQAIMQARFMHYLHSRNLAKTDNRHMWEFSGDGEMQEAESQGLLARAGREKLDNLTLVVNCNLQSLDGLVNGNGKIIQEYESLLHGRLACNKSYLGVATGKICLIKILPVSFLML